MGDRALRCAGVAMGVLALGLFVSGGTLNVDSENILVDIMGLIAFVSPALVGAYLIWRLPRNAIGWTLAGFGLTFTLGVMGETIALTDQPLASFGAWLSTWAWAGSMVLILVLLPLLFPEGRLPSSRFGWVVPTSIVGLALVIFGNAFKPSVVIDGVTIALPIPLDLPLAVFDVSSAMGMALLLVAVGGAVTACVLRFRRSRGLERRQMKLFFAALIASVIGMALNLVMYELGSEALANAIFAGFVLVLVGSIAIAVLRYRLYDLDRVISRTVSYALLVIILGSVYAFGAVWLPTRLAGGRSPLFVAVSTLAVAALFTPLRRRVMTWVDRRFNRSSYDAERVSHAFASHLRSEVDADRLAADWADVVTDTLEPSLVGVWVRADRSG
jgi:hypothetical protein